MSSIISSIAEAETYNRSIITKHTSSNIITLGMNMKTLIISSTTTPLEKSSRRLNEWIQIIKFQAWRFLNIMRWDVQLIPSLIAIIKYLERVKQEWDETSEGPEKAIRGGGEWEPIKISQWNSAYIPKSTWCPSLPTRPRLHRYSKTISLRNWVRDHSGNTKQC
jgi:hypothetical protein